MTSAANRNGWGRSALPSIFNTGIAAMNTASGGSSMPKATAAPIPPKYPRDRGTSICNRPTWTTRPCWVECGADMVASLPSVPVWYPDYLAFNAGTPLRWVPRSLKYS